MNDDVQTLVQRYEFVQPGSDELEYGDRSLLEYYRAGGGAYGVQLRGPHGTNYSVGGDATVRTPMITAHRVVLRRGFEIDADVPDGTSLGFRLDNGTEQLYWSGMAWTAAAAGEWNTAEEVSENLSSLSPAPVEFAVWINLCTTDVLKTPRVRSVAWILDARVVWQDDFLYDTLLKALGEDVLATADYVVPGSTGPAYSVLLPSDEELGLIVADVSSAFDYNNDSDLRRNILGSYNSTSRISTLVSPVAAGCDVLLRMRYRPSVMYSQHVDYEEVARFPSVVVGNMTATRLPPGGRTDAVRNLSAGTAVRTLPPTRVNYSVVLRVESGRAEDVHRLSAAIRSWLDATPFVVSYATGERYRLQHRNPWRQVSDVSGDLSLAAETSIMVYGVVEQTRPAVNVPLVQNFVLDGHVING